ncbi:Protein tyrosine phosphatase type IVA 1 [Linnemannia zychae]|nr:Protein tyrosine phosphatase type IVA 1 [Linnemannia zychae]
MATAMTTTTTTTLVRHHPEARLLNRPAVIDYKHMRFLVSDAPADSNLPLYINEFEKHNTKNVVRVCDPTYGTTALTKLGIKVFDWPFVDGEGPPPYIIRDWLHLVDSVFGKDENHPPTETIAIHCVAGLGRAPLLVAVALIEAGLTPDESIARVREKRRGALNPKQYAFLKDYKRRKSRKSKCTIL